MVLVQISDLHVGAEAAGDPERDLVDAVATIATLVPRPDAVLVTGDLTEHGAPAEYERVLTVLDAIDAPMLPVAGNHDDRVALRSAFPPPAEAAGVGGLQDTLRYSVRCGALRVVVCDTALPGRGDGALDSEQRTWLQRELAADLATPTIVAMHHPPAPIGLPFLDAIGLPAGDRIALAGLLRGFPNVRRVVAGHVHLASFSHVGDCPVMTCPSTWRLRPQLHLGQAGLELDDQPAGVAMHLLVDGDLVSHVQALGDGP